MTSIEVISSTHDSITILWLKPNITNGFIVGYKVTSGMANRTEGSVLPSVLISVQSLEVNGFTSTYTFQNLQANTRYAIVVQAITAAGMGPVGQVAYSRTLRKLTKFVDQMKFFS